MRFILTLLALLVTMAFAFGQKVTFSSPDRMEGTLKAFGKVMGADGRMHVLNGVEFPYVATRIDPSQIVKLRPRTGSKSHRNAFIEAVKDSNAIDPGWLASMEPAPAMFDTTVYQADHGNGTYGVFDPEGGFGDPTSLDDHLMSNGAGRLWQNMQFGVNITESRVFICRWIIYSQFTGGLGHNVNAYSGVVADFGVKLATNPPFYTQPYQVGAWAFTIDVSPQPFIGWQGISCPNNQIYMAQQFRWPHIGQGGVEDGEGPFDVSQFNLWDVAGAPLVGSSDNSFYYDWDDQDGKYADDELEVFEAPNYADLLRTITVRGTVERVNPGTMDVFGTNVNGSIFELFDADQSYVTFKPRWDTARNDPNGMVTVEGVTTSSSVNSIQFYCVAAASLSGGTQDVQFFNYQTSGWDTVDTRDISGQDTTVSIFMTTNLSRYIAANRHLKARVRFFPPASANRSYTLRVDQMVWTLTHP